MAVEAAPQTGRVEVEVTAPRRSPGSTADKVGNWVLAIWSGLAVLYLFIPVFIVVLFSFNNPKGRFNFTWQGFTLEHWAHPFADPDLASALKNSLVIALISTLIPTALGTFMPLALVR